MSENENGGVAADDAALFDSVTSEVPATETPVSEIPEIADIPQTATPEATQQQTNSSSPSPAIPPSRLREEAEARRALERERDELRGRLAAFEQHFAPQRQQPQQPQQAPEIWDNPEAAIRHAVAPQITQVERVLDALAEENANLRFPGKVEEAKDALQKAINSRSIDQADAQRILNAPNRYVAIVEWRQRQQMQTEIGGDIQAYQARMREQLLKDPEFLKQALSAARGQAQQTGSHIIRTPSVSTTPSLGRIGSAALPEGQARDVSDAELFEATTSRKRA